MAQAERQYFRQSWASEPSKVKKSALRILTRVTIDHDLIRQWVLSRGGRPAVVRGTGSENDIGLLRIDFPELSADGVFETISWEAFFHKFEQKQYAFLYQNERASGEISRFCEFIKRETTAKAS